MHSLHDTRSLVKPVFLIPDLFSCPPTKLHYLLPACFLFPFLCPLFVPHNPVVLKRQFIPPYSICLTPPSISCLHCIVLNTPQEVRSSASVSKPYRHLAQITLRRCTVQEVNTRSIKITCHMNTFFTMTFETYRKLNGSSFKTSFGS